MIQTLRNEIRALQNEIASKQARIDELLHDEARINELLEMIRNANLNVEQLEAIVDAINNMDNENSVPSIIVPVETPTVETPTVETPTVLVINNETNEQQEFEITDEMRNSYLTVVGVSHQPLFEEEHYTPQIGELVYLVKETETSNCYAMLEHSDINNLDEDKSVGILPTVHGDKPAELNALGLPCKTHQSMWQNDDLDCVYIITGVINGKYVTLNKYINPATGEQERTDVTDGEESPSNTDLQDIERLCDDMASTVEEARRIFNNEMPDHCVISEIQDLGLDFLISYHNHRANTMDGVNQQVVIRKAIEDE